MMMQRKVLVLFGILLMVFGLYSKESFANGLDNSNMVVTPSVKYATHVQDIGWLNAVSDGEMSGTEGQAKRLESIKISVDNVQDLGVKYSTHVQDYGWLDYVNDGKESGTTGEGKRLEAIKIELTGTKAENYDIYYRVHSETYGWLGWAKNGEAAGTNKLAKRLEAIEIVLVEKGGEAPGSTDRPFLTKPTIIYSTQVETYGWLNFVKDGAMSGTKGQGKRLEAIKINLQGSSYSGDITYSTHVQDYGWLNNVSNGEVSGTVGQSKRLEAIKIGLTGDIANYFDVYYRVHTQDYGWLGWAKNGMKAGTEGLSKRLEAIEIKLVPKGQGGTVTQKEAFKQPLRVFLDPGHGGADPGATAGGYRESDLNLTVAKKVQSLLINRGYTVYMSRNNDTSVSLIDRPQMANDVDADIFVSIHTNSTGSGATTAVGMEAYYYEYDPNYPSKINGEMHNNPERISKSVKLANLIHENMVEYTGAADRGTDGETFAVIREAAMPATLLEMGFINNSSERQQLVKDSYQNILAKAIADGIDEYFEFY
jgi:N-acetylmuramoyl-L-alanine amidase